MDIEEALEICRYWQKPGSWRILFDAMNMRREFIRDHMRNTTAESQDRLTRSSKVLKRITDFQDALSEWIRQNRQDLIVEIPIVDGEELEHIKDYCKSMQRVEAGILSGSPSTQTKAESIGRRPDADRTQRKNSGKNHRPWDANCERMAKAYIRQCAKDGREVSRIAFITEELRRNGTRYPDAKAASTIDRAFRENKERWRPALTEALNDRTQTGRSI